MTLYGPYPREEVVYQPCLFGGSQSLTLSLSPTKPTVLQQGLSFYGGAVNTLEQKPSSQLPTLL